MLVLRQLVPPAIEPVSVAQAKAHCRIDTDADDTLVALYITAARQYAEKRIGRALITQTWQLSLDTFPWGMYRHTPGPRSSYRFSNDYWSASMSILLPRPPLIAVESITYLDITGTTQTLSPNQYIVNTSSEPARVVPAIGLYWPYLEAYQPSSVQVTYTAGYGSSPTDVPSDICLAILMLTAHFYDNRATSSQNLSVTTIPLAVDALLDPHAVVTFAYEQ